MGIRSQVQSGSKTYTIVSDIRILYRVLISGVVLDEVTQQSPRSGFLVKTGRYELQPRSVKGGLFCIAGYSQWAFPDLDSTSYTVDLSFTAHGYQPTQRSVNIPQNASFPIELATAVRLRPLPVRIQGRAVERSANRDPLADVRVIIVDDPLASSPPTEHVIALRSPLRFKRASGTIVRERTLNPVGAPKQLHRTAFGGSQKVILDNRTGLAANDIIKFGSGTRVEFALIADISPTPVDMTQPGEVTLHSRLNQTFPVSTAVQEITLGAVGLSRSLVHEADVGDGVLIVDGLMDVETIEVTSATPEEVEYHDLGALTDSQGYYHLNGIGRTHTIHLKASLAGYEDLILPWRIDFGKPVNVVNFMLKTPSP